MIRLRYEHHAMEICKHGAEAANDERNGEHEGD